jgi:hypothetical protein
MKNELAMVLFSRRSLTESAAREQIAALRDFGGGLMCPDTCSEFEPIKTVFDRADISGPIRWLAKPHGEFLYKKGHPLHMSGEMWNKTHPSTARFPSPLFSNYWTGRFDGNWAAQVGIDRVEEFVSEMFRVTCSDFALLTTEIDLKAKNSVASSYSYKGLDLGLGVPGLYWMNLFSNDLANWLGLSGISGELAQSRNIAGNGVLLTFGDSPEHCRDDEILQRQRATIDWLGPAKFFDIRLPDRALDTPDWDRMPLRSAELAE